MSKSLKTNTYTTLVNDIAELYSRARNMLVESYWQIGRRIVEQEQQGEGKAGYGVRLLEHLSEDLQHRLGSGFSIRNLRNMRRFYLNHRIRQPAAELNWSQHVELLPVMNQAHKRSLEKRIIRNNLSRRRPDYGLGPRTISPQERCGRTSRFTYRFMAKPASRVVSPC